MKDGLSRRGNFIPALAVVCAFLAGILISPGASAQVDRNINDYVLFAYDQLIFKGGNTNAGFGFINGNIGVNYPGQAHIGTFSLDFATDNFAIMSDGSQAVADSVNGGSRGSFYDLYANSLNPSFASTIRNGGTNSTYSTPIIATGLLPVLPFTAAHTNLTNTGSDITVGGTGLSSPYTFTPGAYHNVRINDNSTAIFGPGTFDMRDLSIGMDVNIIVDDNTILQIDETFNPNNNLRFGLGTASGAHIYVGAFGLNVDTTRSGSFSSGAEIHAQYFSPTGWLDIGSQGNYFGHYWAQVITGDPNNNIPEPATNVLVGLGLAGLLALTARKQRVPRRHE